MKRILVCGGRDYTDQERVFRILDKALDTFKEVIIIQGGATGADTCAKNWALSRGMLYDEYPAEWDRFGKRAGYIRNALMIDVGKPELVIVFPGGKGTDMMAKLAVDAGIQTFRIPNESMKEDTQ
jgi:hypothetical protein